MLFITIDFSPHLNIMNNLGHKGSSEKIKSCLEESLVLFDWDRPTIVSPVKLVNILYTNLKYY